MVTMTMAFIPDVNIVISYGWVKSCPSSRRLCSKTHFSNRPVRGKSQAPLCSPYYGCSNFFWYGASVLEGFMAIASGQLRFNMELSAQHMHRWPWERDCIRTPLDAWEGLAFVSYLGCFLISRSNSEWAHKNHKIWTLNVWIALNIYFSKKLAWKGSF
jgi:hypothetical protein